MPDDADAVARELEEGRLLYNELFEMEHARPTSHHDRWQFLGAAMARVRRGAVWQCAEMLDDWAGRPGSIEGKVALGNAAMVLRRDLGGGSPPPHVSPDALLTALKGAVAAMEVQQGRMDGSYHLSATAMSILWNGALETARAALKASGVIPAEMEKVQWTR